MFAVGKKPAITSLDKEFPYYVSLVNRNKIDTSLWKKIPRALNIADASEYVRFLKTQYSDRVDIRTNPTYLPSRINGIKVSFKSLQDVEELIKILNRR